MQLLVFYLYSIINKQNTSAAKNGITQAYHQHKNIVIKYRESARIPLQKKVTPRGDIQGVIEGNTVGCHPIGKGTIDPLP
ncbi:hypothetical protein [Nostoc sp. KVJ20]|uniref:hypothetical protein n=1 Tax=Nostoc sp. KVJ20 TaxID=457944 RepID=UPI00114CC564|nr:hypothetical protein [Nostoc sp. KVJ20]